MTGQLQFGVRFQDGSVAHPWNGRTQLQRATEEQERLRREFPRDTFELVVREREDGPWITAE